MAGTFQQTRPFIGTRRCMADLADPVYRGGGICKGIRSGLPEKPDVLSVNKGFDIIAPHHCERIAGFYRCTVDLVIRGLAAGIDKNRIRFI
jgi:hypothetical protein